MQRFSSIKSKEYQCYIIKKKKNIKKIVVEVQKKNDLFIYNLLFNNLYKYTRYLLNIKVMTNNFFR